MVYFRIALGIYITSVATLDVGNVIRLMLLLIAVGVTAHVVKLRNSLAFTIPATIKGIVDDQCEELRMFPHGLNLLDNTCLAHAGHGIYLKEIDIVIIHNIIHTNHTVALQAIVYL